MRKTEGNPLGPAFASRLRVALDRVQPRNSPPRYQTTPALRTWRLAPTALAIGVTGVLVLTLFAASGSSNAAELRHRIVNVIQSNSEPSPTPPPTPPEAKAAPIAPPEAESSPGAESSQATGSTQRPEPDGSPRPNPTSSPEPGEDHSTWPTPTPTTGDH